MENRRKKLSLNRNRGKNKKQESKDVFILEPSTIVSYRDCERDETNKTVNVAENKSSLCEIRDKDTSSTERLLSTLNWLDKSEIVNWSEIPNEMECAEKQEIQDLPIEENWVPIPKGCIHCMMNRKVQWDPWENWDTQEAIKDCCNMQNKAVVYTRKLTSQSESKSNTCLKKSMTTGTRMLQNINEQVHNILPIKKIRTTSTDNENNDDVVVKYDEEMKTKHSTFDKISTPSQKQKKPLFKSKPNKGLNASSCYTGAITQYMMKGSKKHKDNIPEDDKNPSQNTGSQDALKCCPLCTIDFEPG
ncbi:uncharacterized protein LOC102808493, partial [Saccoglossus kowalevskii]|uniref:Uncharacterized protein LOC102808493 n=1 Tax=Saccoglossus kowalevskii TaxID=10224 RepID=A0ABM0M6A3_SACKO